MADAETVRQAADEILARPEYRRQGPSLVDRLFDWLVDRVGEVLAKVSGGLPGGYLVGWVIVAVVVGASLLMIVRVLPPGGPDRKRRPPAPVFSTGVGRVGRREWLERADQAEQAGQWREATVARYRALVAGLVERSELDDAPGATSGEHVRALVGSQDRRSTFDAATRRFEDVWYGAAPADKSDPAAVGRAEDVVLGSK